MTTKYRYRDNFGSTAGSLKAARRNVHKVGKILKIQGVVYKGKWGNNAAVRVIGENGTARFNDFSWGYSGTGPAGLVLFLESVGVSAEVAAETAYRGAKLYEDHVGVIWEIDYSPRLNVIAMRKF